MKRETPKNLAEKQKYAVWARYHAVRAYNTQKEPNWFPLSPRIRPINAKRGHRIADCGLRIADCGEYTERKSGRGDLGRDLGAPQSGKSGLGARPPGRDELARPDLPRRP